MKNLTRSLKTNSKANVLVIVEIYLKGIIHPKAVDFQNNKAYGHWVQDILYYDYSLLLLAESVKYTAKIQPICLPTKSNQGLVRSHVYTSGWGATKLRLNAESRSEGVINSNVPIKITVEVIDYKTCENSYTLTGCKHCKQESVICTYGVNRFNSTVKEDACQGDSGGMLHTLFLL